MQMQMVQMMRVMPAMTMMTLTLSLLLLYERCVQMKRMHGGPVSQSASQSSAS